MQNLSELRIAHFIRVTVVGCLGHRLAVLEMPSDASLIAAHTGRPLLFTPTARNSYAACGAAAI